MKKRIHTNQEFYTRISNVWDSEKNILHWSNYSRGSIKSVWLKCNTKDYHGSYLISCNNFSAGKGCPFCGGQKTHPLDSFAQFHINYTDINFINKYWDREKNILSPYDLSVCSTKKVWIKCQKTDYHNSYEIMCHNFTNGKRCSYCQGTLTHILDSFLHYHTLNTDPLFLKKYWDFNKNALNPSEIKPQANKYIYIKCQNVEYHDSYRVVCSDFTNGQRCPSCHNFKVHELDSLAHLYPQSTQVWSEQNTKKPNEYFTKSWFVAWWKCENHIHEDFQRKIQKSVQFEFRCPQCTQERDESFLQEKVRKYLNNELKYKCLHEHKCNIIPINPKTKQHLPFDNEVIDLKLIIEVHGKQHYETIPYFEITQSLHKRQLYDRYKRMYAISQGYNYIAIPYWAEKDDMFKKLIYDKIYSNKIDF